VSAEPGGHTACCIIGWRGSLAVGRRMLKLSRSPTETRETHVNVNVNVNLYSASSQEAPLMYRRLTF